MKIALKDGQILIKEADENQFLIIKSWGKMKWSKPQELLNKLSGIVRLPGPIEDRRQRLNEVAAAIDRERLKKEPEPLYKYPVKKQLYQHQTRGANMALMAFGLIAPPKEEVAADGGK